jgi:hypothetical protein
MYKINDDQSIYVTRGDAISFIVGALDEEGNDYVFKPTDTVRFSVFNKKACHLVELRKDFSVSADSETIEIFLTGEDTKIGEHISKPVDYWYEVELNPNSLPQTIIGYDDDGPKVFRLFPEGGDLV